MAQHIEPLSGGLVTSRDPSLLGEGELQKAEDCMYLPNDPAIYGALGRSQLNAASLGPITGLKFCAFDSPDADLLVAQANSTYIRMGVDGGNVVSMGSITEGDSMDSIHYRNRHVLVNGVNENKVLLKDGTLRPHGMKPVTATLSATVFNSGGQWPLGADSVPNWYEYWVTEVYKTETEDVESTFIGIPATRFVNDVNDYVELGMPTPVNDHMTHWRVYRSISKSVDVGTAFPSGFLIAELPRSTESFNDGLQTVTAPTAPTVLETSAPYLTFLQDYFRLPNATFPVWGGGGGTILTDDTQYTTGTSSNNVFPTMVLSGFDFGTINSPISGIQITVEGFHDRTDGWVAFFLSPDNGNTGTFLGSSHLGTGGAGAPLTVIIPPVAHTWGRNWIPSELGASFRVFMYCSQSNTSGSVTTGVDYVTVKVTHKGSTADTSTEFPAVEVTTEAGTTAVGRHGPPVIASTGDIFEESLVTNDVSNPTLIAYSTQENIDSFPPTYALSFQTKDKDTVRCVKSMGNILMVGMYGKLFRVNYLPREADAEFDRGRAIDLISTDHGIVGPKAAATFQMDGQPLMMAYVSRYGIHMTEGYRSTTLTNDLRWADTVDVSGLDDCELVNDAENYEIVLFYQDPEGIRKRLNFSYHPIHLKDGKLKVSGPVNYGATSATSAGLDSGSLGFFTGKEDGFVYMENVRGEDASGGTITPLVKTRSMYLTGPGQEWQIQKGLLHHAGSGTITYKLEVEKTNAEPRETGTRVTNALGRGMSRLLFNDVGEGISVVLQASEPGTKFNYLVVEGDGFGTEDSLK